TVNDVFEEVDRLDAQMSNYKPESELSHINREAAREDVVVEPRLFGLVQLSLRLSEDTGGAFDITVGPLMKSWDSSVARAGSPARRRLALSLSAWATATFIWMRPSAPSTLTSRVSSWTWALKRRAMRWTAP